MLTPIVPIVPTYTVFEFDGTQQSIDDFSTLLSADGGQLAVHYVNATTYNFKNPGFDNVFYPRDISERVVVSKYPTIGATMLTTLPPIAMFPSYAIPDNIYWAAA